VESEKPGKGRIHFTAISGIRNARFGSERLKPRLEDYPLVVDITMRTAIFSARCDNCAMSPAMAETAQVR